MIETWFQQDLDKAVRVQYLDGNVFSLDNNGNIVGVECFRDGSPAPLTGSVSASVIRADGATIAVSGTLSGNRASIAMPQAACAVPGVVSIVIKVTNGAEVCTVGAIVATVYRSSTDSTVDPGTVIPSIDALIAEIEAAVATIPADYSALWATIAPNFSANTSYAEGQYVTYNGGVYRFKTDHSGTWASADVVAVTVGRELARHEDFSASIADAIYTIGAAGESTVKLTGEIVPYRYQGANRIDTQTSLLFKLPERAKTVRVTMHVLSNINSYTLFDENMNVLGYKREEAQTDVDYTLYAWEAAYLLCSNNNTYIDTISVTATIAGVDQYIAEAKKASGEQYALLHGEPQNTYFYLLEESAGNYSVKYNVSGYDYVDISSFNVSNTNKYTMLDANGNVVSFFLNDVSEDVGVHTEVKVAVPSNVVTMYVSTYRRERPNVVVYGVKEPDSFEWENCAGSFVGYVYQAQTYFERENGSKEFAANPFDIFRLVDGKNAAKNNAFTAFDSEGNVIGYSQFADADQPDLYFICPKGTVKVAVAGARLAAGWGTCATMTIQRRKLTGKKISVMGDSISTYRNFIPDGNAVYYEWGNRGVPTAAYLWWGVVAREMGFDISTVNAWSGSQVSNTGGATATSSMCMARTANLADRGTPDVIVIYGGVNDYMHEVALGTWAGKADIPTTGDNFRKAYAMMLNKIHANYPLAKVYCCTLANLERDTVPGSLENRGGQWLHEFNSAIREIAPIMNCSVIEVESCGINQYNMATYMGDYNGGTGSGLHPNAAGHALIAQRILKSLRGDSGE